MRNDPVGLDIGTLGTQLVEIFEKVFLRRFSLAGGSMSLEVGFESFLFQFTLLPCACHRRYENCQLSAACCLLPCCSHHYGL